MLRHSTVRKGTGCISGEKGISRTGTLSRGDASVESLFVPQHAPFTGSTVKGTRRAAERYSLFRIMEPDALIQKELVSHEVPSRALVRGQHVPLP